MISTTVSSIHVLLCITVLASDSDTSLIISVPHHNPVLLLSYHYTKLITYIRWLWINTLRRDMDDLNMFPFSCIIFKFFLFFFLEFYSVLSFLYFVHYWITMHTHFSCIRIFHLLRQAQQPFLRTSFITSSHLYSYLLTLVSRIESCVRAYTSCLPLITCFELNLFFVQYTYLIWV